MYKAFYGLSRPIFPKNIEASKMFAFHDFNELSGRLSYMKSQHGIMLISGEPGTGKTTAVRNFTDTLNKEYFLPLYIPLSTVASGDFYKQLNDILKGDSCYGKSMYFKSIQKRIIHYSNELNKIPVIIIDEAHLLKNENFFELQIISNFNMDSIDPALFILIAQSHLNDRLSRTFLESFNQRIGMKFSFSSLSPIDVKQYVIHHLKIAGGSQDIFTDNAYKAIHNISGGILRKVGLLTIKSLSLGVSLKKNILTEEEVLSASREL